LFLLLFSNSSAAGIAQPLRDLGNRSIGGDEGVVPRLLYASGSRG